jgi:uncharacterized protein (DUF934 family)
MMQIIKILEGRPQIVEDPWTVERSGQPQDAAGDGHRIVPFAEWKENPQPQAAGAPRGVWIAPDDEFEAFADRLGELDMLAVDFPSFRDGRGYSVGYLLRTRYGWKKELRAVGDILRDQLNYLRRCGFDAFALRPDKNIHDALNSFSRYSVQYQGAVDEPLPLFRRARTTGG